MGTAALVGSSADEDCSFTDMLSAYGPTEVILSTPRHPSLKKLPEAFEFRKALFERGSSMIILHSFATSALNSRPFHLTTPTLH
jgi:hypothetical protein